MNITNGNGADVNDVIVCANCSHRLTVTHEWLDRLTLRAGSTRVFRLEERMLVRLCCGQCKEKRFEVHQAMLPVSIVAPHATTFLCTICGGDGGAGGRCWKCGGTGFHDVDEPWTRKDAAELSPEVSMDIKSTMGVGREEPKREEQTTVKVTTTSTVQIIFDDPECAITRPSNSTFSLRDSAGNQVTLHLREILRCLSIAEHEKLVTGLTAEF